MTWTVPETGRIVAGGGHVHGGGKTRTDPQTAAQLRALHVGPTWGGASHPFYNVKPGAARAGPDQHERLHQRRGLPACSGREAACWTPNYDGEQPHTRVMGIMVDLPRPGRSGEPAKLHPPGRPRELPRPSRARPSRRASRCRSSGSTGSGKAREDRGAARQAREA